MDSKERRTACSRVDGRKSYPESHQGPLATRSGTLAEHPRIMRGIFASSLQGSVAAGAKTGPQVASWHHPSALPFSARRPGRRTRRGVNLALADHCLPAFRQDIPVTAVSTVSED